MIITFEKRMNSASASHSEKVHCFSGAEKEIYASRPVFNMRDIFSAIDEALLLLCGGERKQILNSYSELLSRSGTFCMFPELILHLRKNPLIILKIFIN